VFIGEPAVACTTMLGSPRIDVVGLGTDWHYYHGVMGSGSIDTGLGGPYLGPPTMGWQSGGMLDVIGQGTDSKYYDNQAALSIYGLSWGATSYVGGPGISGPTIIDTSAQTLGEGMLFVEGTDHHAYWKSVKGTVWQPSQNYFFPTLGGTLQ
jgi:hypothetical protein